MVEPGEPIAWASAMSGRFTRDTQTTACPSAGC